jgi:hypothetical protein
MRKSEFEDKDKMWDFIGQHKGAKFDFDGTTGALWWSIEKSEDERLKASRVSHLVRTTVAFLVSNAKIPIALATKRVVGDYVRGYIMFITNEVSEKGLDGTKKIITKKTHQRLFESKWGESYFVKEGAREIEVLKELEWDEMITHVNGLVTKSEAYASS